MTRDVSRKPPRGRQYCGDGVYVEYDGSQLILTVPAEASGDGCQQRIYLEPGVFNEVNRYAKAIGYGQT